MTNPLVHTPGRSTELAAFRKVERKIAGIKSEILVALQEAGETGLTPDEFCDDRDMLINTVRRRFTDLWKEGEIKPTDRTRKNSNDNECLVWTLGCDPDRNKNRVQTRKELMARITQLEETVAKLTRQNERLIQIIEEEK